MNSTLKLCVWHNILIGKLQFWMLQQAVIGLKIELQWLFASSFCKIWAPATCAPLLSVIFRLWKMVVRTLVCNATVFSALYSSLDITCAPGVQGNKIVVFLWVFYNCTSRSFTVFNSTSPILIPLFTNCTSLSFIELNLASPTLTYFIHWSLLLCIHSFQVRIWPANNVIHQWDIVKQVLFRTQLNLSLQVESHEQLLT